MNMADEDLLWLRRPQERDQPPSRHAVLWPAMEYTALVFVPGAPSATKLDPFERAVAGAAANGLVENGQQAAVARPDEGSQPSWTEKTSWSMRPNQKTGMAMPRNEKPVLA